MKTYKHKASEVLATVVDKTCYMSNASGKIYKQFPAEHLKLDAYEETEFPTDFNVALEDFKHTYAEKRMQAEKKKEAQRKAEFERQRKEYEERKRLLLILRGMRKAFVNGEENVGYYVVSNRCGYDTATLEEETMDPCWQDEEGYPMVFGNKDEADTAFKDAVSKAHPDENYENDIELLFVNLGEDVMDYTDTSVFNKYYDYDFDVLKEEFVEAEYQNIQDAVIACVSWETYVGYCMNFHSIRYGGFDETEKDIVSMNNERVFRPWEYVVCTADEIEGMTDEEKLDYIMERMGNNPWNRFKRCLTRKKIIEQLGLNVEE